MTFAIVEFRDRRGNPRARVVNTKKASEPVFSGEDYADAGKRKRELSKFFAEMKAGKIEWWTEKDVAARAEAKTAKGAKPKAKGKAKPAPAKPRTKPKAKAPKKNDDGAIEATPAEPESTDPEETDDGFDSGDSEGTESA